MKTRLPAAPQRVLVTGGAGYLGSVVIAQLLARGFRVRVLDSLLFGEQSLDNLRSHANCEFIRGDVRDIESVVSAMNGCDTAIHLAGIVGDQACEANRQLAIEVNGAATRMLADEAPRCGIRRFLFASSCSVYGSNRGTVTESSRLRPLSLYARTKIDSEKILLGARTRRFAPTVLRLGTLFGLSPRMRFDLVVNLLTARAVSAGRITIKNGWQWRPFVHVQDAARAFLACLESPAERVSGEVFNVGSHSLNTQIRHLGEVVVRVVPNTAITEVYDRIDQRTYRASFGKIKRVLGFVCRETLEAGVREISAALASCGTVGFSADASTKEGFIGSSVHVVGNQVSSIHAIENQASAPRRLSLRAKLNREPPPGGPLRPAASTSITGD
jgi:nucleoside-diphosphate-sugar epimerase